MKDTVEAGFCVFCTILCDEGIEDAKNYIRAHNWTRDDVKLVSTDGVVMVKTIREMDIGKTG